MKSVGLGDALGSEELNVDGKTYSFSWYQAIVSTNLLNSHGFSIMPSAHSSIASQMDKGVKTYYRHQVSERPLGMTRNARVYAKKVRGEMGIQENLQDVNSNDIISRIDTGVLNEASISFIGGKMMCDLCDTQMRRWLFGYYCQNEHDLGYKIKQNGKEVLVTGKLYDDDNTLELREVSVVDTGSDPGTSVKQQLQEIFEGQELTEGYLKATSLLNNFSFDEMCNTLSFNPSSSRPERKSFVPGADLQNSKRDNTMAKPEDKDILEESAADAMKEVERLTTENDELTEELETRPTQEDYDAISEELEQTKLKLKELEDQGTDKLVEIGQEALRLARRSALTAYCSYHGYEEGSDEWNFQEDKLSKNMDMTALRDSASHYRALKNSKRAGGRKSEGTFVAEGKNSTSTDWSGNNSVLG